MFPVDIVLYAESDDVTKSPFPLATASATPASFVTYALTMSVPLLMFLLERVMSAKYTALITTPYL